MLMYTSSIPYLLTMAIAILSVYFFINWMKGSKGKTAFCFPGQLHEKPILEDHHPLREDPHFKEVLRRVSSQTKFDLLHFSFGDEDEAEDFSLKLQIATYILSMVHYYRLRAAGWNPNILAEHSMGIYAALAASEAITFEEGLWVTESIGRILEREGASSRGAMASIAASSHSVTMHPRSGRAI
jgi:malonyl CoA-acyl carrier protein transacylase